jgi:hypothetical protein
MKISIQLSFLIRVCVCVNVCVAILAACWLGLYPAWTTAKNLGDPALRDGNIPAYAKDMHRRLSPKIARWAERRAQSARPVTLTGADVSGTEWPLFGSAFYLWATESLQDAWEAAPQPKGDAPKVYAHDAIAASVRLILDPKHGSWVYKMWGDSYLTHENIFYRFLRIAALTAQVQLLDDAGAKPVLREEVDRLAAEIDASPAGLLEDYPGECYPGDVAQALAVIRRADALLGGGHGVLLERAYRGFDETKTDPKYHLPPYFAVAETGHIITGARGCSNSYFCMTGPELWPDAAKKWYDAYERHFWQQDTFLAGFREFPKDRKLRDWYFDVDAGPCVAGYGFAATAFGLAAARINGRLDHAYPLAAETIAATWTLPNGRMFLPALLSNCTDAPYLGEECILFTLSRVPQPGVAIHPAGKSVLFPRLLIAAYLLCAALVLFISLRAAKRAIANPIVLPKIQMALWAAFLCASLLLFARGNTMLAVYCLLITQVFPLQFLRRKKHPEQPAS